MGEVRMNTASTKEEMLERASDHLRDVAHSVAMMKKGVTLQSDVTPEEYDMALAREMEKAWDEVKDLDYEEYVWRGIGEMLMSGVDPERIFGEEDGKEDR